MHEPLALGIHSVVTEALTGLGVDALKRECVNAGPSDVAPMERAMPVFHNPELCPACKESICPYCKKYVDDFNERKDGWCFECKRHVCAACKPKHDKDQSH